MKKVLISEGFCFNPNNNLTTDISNKALRKYADGFEIAKNLEGTLPIIIDSIRKEFTLQNR